MAGGDETVLGPYDTNAAGVTAAGAAMDTAWGNAADTYTCIPCANGLQFYIIHIAGA